MKILLVSMPSIHFFRWAEQLKGAGHDVFWFDILGGTGKVERLNWLKQFVGWKLKWDYLGRHFIKSKFPKAYLFFQKFNENNTAKEFEKILNQEKPDVVHSFALYVSCTPILKVMMKYPRLKWIYSSWGSDLYYFQNLPKYLEGIKKVLPRVDYLFTDCKRDYNIALNHGFNGEFFGVFPGGGGFDIQKMNTFSVAISNRNIILIKGYQGRSGRAVNILRAIEDLCNELLNYKIVVFGADPKVISYFNNSNLLRWKNLEVLEKISREDVLELMGKTLIYIGNSNSDGLPNTLLEAICLGAFPIQSNPGGVTEEVIENNINGLLIENCENIEEVRLQLKKAIQSPYLIDNAFKHNKKIKQTLEYGKLKSAILEKYKQIDNLVH